MRQLITPWGEQQIREKKTKDILQEYPRPQMVRNSYLNLNGLWDYAFTKEPKAPEKYDGEILVPYSPETLLSGVNRQLQPDEYLCYRKNVVLPESFFTGRTLLHFDAVDQECTVWFNGHEVGKHQGGYLRISCEVSEYLQPGNNEILLIARDQTEFSPHGRGKQKLHKKGFMSYLYYTAQSGIWKTVWMENVPENYVESLYVDPIFDEEKLRIKLAMSEHSRFNPEIHIFGEEKEVSEIFPVVEYDEKNVTITALLNDFHSWCPEDPFLYRVQIKAGEDVIETYAGMRKFGVVLDAQGFPRFELNNKPYFVKGVLDQGYWPESLMTPPCDDALLYDIQQCKKLGYNTIRKHVKVEAERFYYHCDREGVLVWQDMPNGGGEYDHMFVTYLPNFIGKFRTTVKDQNYKRMKRTDEAGRKQYYEDLKEMVLQLKNYPSIVVWVPFNEGWGQFDAHKATELIRSCDTSRLVNEACGWFDQGGGDIQSIHNYSKHLKFHTEQRRVTAVTECGGYSFVVKDHVSCERRFGYQSFKTVEELNKSYRYLFEHQMGDAIPEGLSGVIYTQMSDIEEETNGLMTYDRKVLKIQEIL